MHEQGDRGREDLGVTDMLYVSMIEQAKGILEEEPWYVSALSNLSSLIMAMLPDLNWAGFYLLRNGRLTVGPFQGKPACIHIDPGKGVCGTAVIRDETVVVPDVHQFPGHIACDGASESEIVIPIHADGRVAAVLDIDSPVKNRFSPEDREGLERLVGLIEEKVNWTE
jgi:GAF domain-containing protein